MVTGMQGTMFALAAIVAMSLLFARELSRATADARRKARVLAIAMEDLKQCFSATERVLSDDRVPSILKDTLLNQARALADPEIGRPVIRRFVKLCEKHSAESDEAAANGGSVGKAIDALYGVDPVLAGDCRAAMTQGMLALLFMHTDVTIEAAASEVARSPYGVPASVGQLFGASGTVSPA